MPAFTRVHYGRIKTANNNASEVPIAYKTIHLRATKRPTFVSFTRHILSLFVARGREYIMFYY